MWASVAASTMARFFSLRITSSTVTSSVAVLVMAASPGSRYTWTPYCSEKRRKRSQKASSAYPGSVKWIPPPRLIQLICPSRWP
ncbi:Uncharacterised protein [Bordetella pertussis]|nr:Uncharacterised protein [Bordetella pertussis]CFU82762.1 Uncharacterised protein [Bordetella pertussis]CPI09528.1 Uncharacterised protein [Bordetella pertussis]